MKRKIVFNIESKRGHDSIEVDEDKAPEEANKHLVDGKWVTLEKNDGTTTILTEPVKIESKQAEATTEKKEEWKNMFGPKKEEENKFAENFKDVKSAMVTGKAKGA